MRFRDMIPHIWTTHRALLILLVLLVFANVSLVFVTNKVLAPQVAEQEKRFLNKQTEVRHLLRTKGNSAQSPEQLYLLGKQDLSAFYETIPEYNDFTSLIEEIIVLADRSSLGIDQINYNLGSPEVDNLLPLKLSFNVAGDYEKIKRFIYSLEQSVRLIVIRQISLQGQVGDEVNLRLVIETYFLSGETNHES